MRQFQNWLIIKLVPSFKLRTRHLYPLWCKFNLWIFPQWKSIKRKPLDEPNVIYECCISCDRAFNYLFVFFINELSLRDTGNGAFVLKTAYQPHFQNHHHPRWQNMIRVPHPTEISAWVARQHPPIGSYY